MPPDLGEPFPRGRVPAGVPAASRLADLPPGSLGLPLVALKSASSTNDVALWLASHGCPDGLAVVAERQWAGRGRLGRTWHSPPGAGLWVSLVLRPALPVARAQALTFLGALSAAAAVRAIHGLDVRLKWPNDLRLGRRKLGGVLVESAGEGALIRYAVVGIGLNVNLDSSGFPPDLRESAVSISAALGRPADRVVLLRRMLTEAGERYALLKAGEAGRLVTEAWSLMDPAVRIVRVCESGRVLEGTVTGLDEDGALLLRLDSGAVERLLAGDVTVLR